MRNGMMAILLVALSTSIIADEAKCPPNYGYDGFLQASQWKYVKGWTCGDKLQSPIRIAGKIGHATKQPIAVFYDLKDVTVENRGHDFRVIPAPGNFIRFRDADGKLIDAPLLNVHFHTPAEHAIKNEGLADVEAHFVHKVGDRYFVIAVFYRVMKTRNNALDPITAKLPLNLCKDAATTLTQRLLPATINHYYRYVGSLTSPGCDPDVTFFIVPRVQPIGGDQLRRLRHFGDNARPLQDREDRPITEVTE